MLGDIRSGRDRYGCWGRLDFPAAHNVYRPRWRSENFPHLNGTMLPYGNGRSYGDSCLNPAGTVIDGRGLDRFIAFDDVSGVLRCEAGVLLSEILEVFVPRGWFLPVTPGTRYVTLGGAIANDVHGKNHHQAGSFGHYVRSLELLRSDGTRRFCCRQENPDWFQATIGGLGLTGLIMSAEIELKRIPGPAMEAEALRFSSLDEFFDLSRTSSDTHEYTVAWLDSPKRSDRTGRGLFFRANHADGAGGAVRPPRKLPGLPFTPPVPLINRPTIALLNTLTYHRPRRPGRVHYQRYFYPLDAMPGWNRLFGRRGMYQYQCVVPCDGADCTVSEILARIAEAGEAPSLMVLKVFGNHPPPGWLSFARPGVTLAIDLCDRGRPTLDLLDSLDEITMAADGAVYPAKDARMRAGTFQRGFPRWMELESYRDPAFMSRLWQRLAAEVR